VKYGKKEGENQGRFHAADINRVLKECTRGRWRQETLNVSLCPE
jgi:hypothetical protein